MDSDESLPDTNPISCDFYSDPFLPFHGIQLFEDYSAYDDCFSDPLLLGSTTSDVMTSLPFFSQSQDPLLTNYFLELTSYSFDSGMIDDSYPISIVDTKHGCHNQSSVNVAVAEIVEESDHIETTGSTDDCNIMESNNSSSLASEYSTTKPPRRNRRTGHVWTKAENELLLRITPIMLSEKKKWSKISERICLGLSGKQCREHYDRLRKGNTKNTWCDDEKLLIQQYKSGEISIDDLYMSLNRTKKQVNERLDIETKNTNPWTVHEEEKVFELTQQYGNNYSRIREMMNAYGFDRKYQQVRCKVSAILKMIQ